MSAARWGRLASDLAAAGIDATVTERPYTEACRGRVQHGVTRSIVIPRTGGGYITIADGWWHKNTDVWIGWQVHTEDADGITCGPFPRATKKRIEVVAAVRTALGGAPQS